MSNTATAEPPRAQVDVKRMIAKAQAFLPSGRYRRTAGFALASLLVLILVVSANVFFAARAGGNVDAVNNALSLRRSATLMFQEMLNAETGQRGFLLTERTRYLGPYEAASPAVDRYLTRLEAYGARDREIDPLTSSLRPLATRKLAELARTIELAQSGRRSQALALVRTDQGQEAMETIRALVHRIEAITDERVSSSIARSRSDAQILTMLTFGGAIAMTVLGALAAYSIIRAIADLNRARREVDELNANLERRVADRTTALTRANDEIQRFAHIVSHDLRAPLVNIMGFTSELETSAKTIQDHLASETSDDGALASAKVAASDDIPEALGFIRTSTAKMDALINAILKLSREGQRELRPVNIDLNQLFEAAIANVRHQLDAAGGEAGVNTQGLHLINDRLALEQIVGNLLDNALKYRHPDRAPAVEITAKARGTRIFIEVADNGRGVAPQDHERVFELFRRAGPQDQRGEGVGLTFVRALVRRMGGEITMSSELGQGTSFLLDLPRVLRGDLALSA